MPNRVDDRRISSQPSQNTYRVASGDTLASIAQKRLGDSNRWSDIFNMNRDRIADPNVIQVGQILRMPTKNGSQPKEEVGSMPADKPIIDSKGNWSVQLANEFGEYVNQHSLDLKNQGYEVDCADLAGKLLKDFCAEKGITNPLGVISKEYIYTPQNSGGLANVNGPNVFMPNIQADSLAKENTKSVNDTDGDGVAGSDRSGAVDVADLRAGDILFYDWDGDGEVNHTVNVVKVDKNSGNVTIAYGSYDNINPEVQPVTWGNLDLTPIQYIELKPGSEEYQKWLGSQNNIWGVRRYNFLPDQAKDAVQPKPAEPKVETPKVEEKAETPPAQETKPAETKTEAQPAKQAEPTTQTTTKPTTTPEKKPTQQTEIPKRHPGAFKEFLQVIFGPRSSTTTPTTTKPKEDTTPTDQSGVPKRHPGAFKEFLKVLFGG